MNAINSSSHPLINPFHAPPMSLEEEFEDKGCFTIDLDQPCGFDDYLSPNEGNPQNIAPHLQAGQKDCAGILVSTGTERSFFDLLFSDEKKCQGLVVRDINPKVKAYVDFNTLLIRLSTTVHEYAELSGELTSPGILEIMKKARKVALSEYGLLREELHEEKSKILKERTFVIENKIKTSGLNEKVKSYFLKNMDHFSSIYFSNSRFWKEEEPAMLEPDPYRHCRYDKDERYFSKLKTYADSGNIICLIGDINDLSFLKNRKVTVVDTSNICDYCFLDLKGEVDFHPRIIWTSQSVSNTHYFSRIFEPLNDQERIEFDALFNTFKASLSSKKSDVLSSFKCELLLYALKNGSKFFSGDPLDSNIVTLYSQGSLSALRSYVNENFIQVPHLGLINTTLSTSIEKFNTLSVDQIHDICQCPTAKSLVSILVKSWVILKPPVYFAFSKIEGWEEEFKRNFTDLSQAHLFLEHLEQKHYPISQDLLDHLLQNKVKKVI